MVIAQLANCDSLVCAITKHYKGKAERVEICEEDFENGSLRISPSYAIPSKILTVDDSLARHVGELTADKTAEVMKKVIDIFQ